MNVKPCNVSQEQRRIINQNIFRSECEKFFGKINRYSLKSNIFLFGKLVDSNGKKGLNEYQVNLIHQGIKTLLAKNQKAETIYLINFRGFSCYHNDRNLSGFRILSELS